MEETLAASSEALPTASAPEVSEQAISDTVTEAVEASQSAESPSKASKPKIAFEDVDSVMKALADQDEVLKTMKTQISDMITTNAALRRGIKQVMQDTSKNDELHAELASARKKLATLKQFLGT